MTAAVHFSSETVEWATPPDLFARLNRKYGPFTLDPCASPDNAKCSTFYTADDDGLRQPWAPHRVFMNPPYGTKGQINRWVRKAYEESQRGALVVGLLPARTDTTWWQDHILGVGAEVRYLRGRVKFGEAKQGASFPSAVTVWRPGNVTALTASRNACEVCRGLLLAGRSDARYCSNACRQRAYRQRGGAT